jgi:hypothetical protein
MSIPVGPAGALHAADFSKLTKVEVGGLWDAVCKLFKGEIRGEEFVSYVKGSGKEMIFDRTFTSRSDMGSKLTPLLSKLNILTAREGKQILELLKTADGTGTTVAMAACLNPQTRAILGELIGKLTIQQQQELLQQKTTGNPAMSLYAYVTANDSKDATSLTDVGAWYQSAHLRVDNGEIIAALAQQEIIEPSGYGINCGGKTLEAQAKDGVTKLAQMLDSIKFKAGEKMTESQVSAFLQWFDEYSQEAVLGHGLSNADIFLAALGGNEFERGQAVGVLEALYNYDDGTTLKEKFLRSRVANLLTDANGLDREDIRGIAEYAREHCLPDATVAVLLDYYTRCGMPEDRNAIEAMSNVGAPLSAQLSKPKDFDAVTSIDICDDTRVTDSGSPLKYTPKVKSTARHASYQCDNIRQMAQFPNLGAVTVDSYADNITVEDLKHLFLEAKKLAVFTIQPRGISMGHGVTKEMAEEARTLANEELRKRSGVRTLLDIEIKVQGE